MMTQAACVLVADDEAPLRDFIGRNLRARGFQVIEATNGEEALAQWEAESPHLLVLDIMMPRIDGLEVCRAIRKRSTVPIIVLTALDGESDKVNALDQGADDYLTKPFGVEELLARVRAALRRTQWHSAARGPHVRTFGPLEVDLDGHTVRVASNEVRLTPTEFSLLALFVTHAGKALTHRYLLQHVWGSEYGGEAEYLRVYVQRLRRKIEPDSANPQYLLTEPGVGYRFTLP
jgi:two-component system, OmpR family, KDP operon response regulator KdpE